MVNVTPGSRCYACDRPTDQATADNVPLCAKCRGGDDDVTPGPVGVVLPAYEATRHECLTAHWCPKAQNPARECVYDTVERRIASVAHLSFDEAMRSLFPLPKPDGRRERGWVRCRIGC